MWIVTSGQALITINDVDKIFNVGDVAIIPLSAKHRVMNPLNEDLIFVEVQIGSYFGEDDIVRIEDDYNRQ